MSVLMCAKLDVQCSTYLRVTEHERQWEKEMTTEYNQVMSKKKHFEN